MKTETYVRLALFMKLRRIFDYLKAQDFIDVEALKKIVEVQRKFVQQ